MAMKNFNDFVTLKAAPKLELLSNKPISLAIPVKILSPVELMLALI
jgi:hypothetical protein